MQCPGCGYEAADTAVFCPQCRYRFRDGAGDTGSDEPGYDGITDDSIFEKIPEGFSDKELLRLEVQLLTPAILVVLIISLFTYAVISAIPFIPVTIAGLSFGVTGIVCLACGLVAGILFFVTARSSLRKSRYR
jgi:hypothetical protein